MSLAHVEKWQLSRMILRFMFLLKPKTLKRLSDGGELSPLTVEEQTIILKALRKSSREYQLMFYLALFTGARLQTICTLRIKNLIGCEPDSHGFIRLPVGAGRALILNFKSR